MEDSLIAPKELSNHAMLIIVKVRSARAFSDVKEYHMEWPDHSLSTRESEVGFHLARVNSVNSGDATA